MSIESLTALISGGVGAVTVLGIWLTLMITGKLHSDDEFQREAKALDKEKEAHEETRKALAEAAARADAAVRASELIASAFSSAAEQRKRRVP